MVRNGNIDQTYSNNGAIPPIICMVEDILKCKWSLTILDLVRRGICRPGAIERATAGLTTKVMNERLAKLVRYNILQRVSYPEVPPRVEYEITDYGQKFVAILDAIEALSHEMANVAVISDS